MSATAATRRRGPSDRYRAFVWISIGIHCLFLFAVLAAAIRSRPERPKVVSIELVGLAPRGDGGGQPEGRPSPERPQPPAPAPAQAAPPTVPSPPPPKPPPTRTVEKTPVRTPPSKPTAQASNPPTTRTSQIPATGSSSAAAKGTATEQPRGDHPGAPGRPDGDTLSVGAGQGLPSPMALWLSRVKFQVERNWRAPEGLAGVQSAPEVVFLVARDGRSSRVQLRTRSGNPTLDRLALRAVQAVESFPPIPEVWPEDRVVVRYVLQYASR